MQTFKSFSEEKAVTLSGGGKTVTLKPGQNVSFKHHATGKTVSGTFRKKKMMGGRQYAHVDMPDKTGMYIPVHHINESIDEEVEQVHEVSSGMMDRYRDAAAKSDTSGMSPNKKFMRQQKYPMLASGKQNPARAALHGLKVKVPSTNEEVVNEKLSDDAKKNIQAALGPKTKGNTLRKTSGPAKAMITIAKSNSKNMK